ncbi:hypothetical protein G9A89_010170 [Geosiphon pyriformis]|nr:hypothetical protein G9A89_010170 [Geosiphon pyriformis]
MQYTQQPPQTYYQSLQPMIQAAPHSTPLEEKDVKKTPTPSSGAAINQDKLIMALYTNAKVRNIDIKLILDSGSVGNCATTAQIITADGNTKTPIGEINNFLFEINRIQIPIKVLITFNRQHAQVLATCRHFQVQSSEELLIEFKDTTLPPTIETYQVSWADDFRTELLLLPTWEEKRKGKAEEKLQSASAGYSAPNSENQNNKANRTVHHVLSVVRSCQMKNSGIMYLAEKEHVTKHHLINWTVTHTMSTKYEKWPVPKPKVPHLAKYEKSKKIYLLADLNTKLCDHCLISCHFQYCDECDLMFNLPPKILFLITKLLELEEEKELTIEDTSF